MNKREHEKAIFNAFMRIEPQFCGEKIAEWAQPEDEKEFPDIKCVSESGLRVGVELGEWLNEDQIRRAKGMEYIQSSILSTIGKQENNNTKNILFIWLFPKPKARIKPTDANAFRDQLYECIYSIDSRWALERSWHSPQGHEASGVELEPYPVVAKYINKIHMFPNRAYQGWPPNGQVVKKKWWDGQDWILFRARGGAFSEKAMLNPLFELLAKKKEHYGKRTGFDHLSLIVYYNTALIYNSPAESLGFTFESAAENAKHFLNDDPDPFQSIFMFVAVDNGRVFKVC